ncbi:unnamed protein product [Amoebophrya sp. A25]|nr:unnamed protein product [Amoebophrya sp. A25]|eukprot:GSA25T00001315001.1
MPPPSSSMGAAAPPASYEPVLAAPAGTRPEEQAQAGKAEMLNNLMLMKGKGKMQLLKNGKIKGLGPRPASSFIPSEVVSPISQQSDQFSPAERVNSQSQQGQGGLVELTPHGRGPRQLDQLQPPPISLLPPPLQPPPFPPNFSSPGGGGGKSQEGSHRLSFVEDYEVDYELDIDEQEALYQATPGVRVASSSISVSASCAGAAGSPAPDDPRRLTGRLSGDTTGSAYEGTRLVRLSSLRRSSSTTSSADAGFDLDDNPRTSSSRRLLHGQAAGGFEPLCASLCASTRNSVASFGDAVEEMHTNYMGSSPLQFEGAHTMPAPTAQEAEDAAERRQKPVFLLTHPFPVIRVMRHKPKLRDSAGKPLTDKETGETILGREEWFSVDNRRLLCLQRRAVLYEELFDVECVCMCVEMLDDTHHKEIKKFRTRTNGETVEIGFYKGHGRANVQRKMGGPADDQNGEGANAGEEEMYWDPTGGPNGQGAYKKASEIVIGANNNLWDSQQARDFVRSWRLRNEQQLKEGGGSPEKYELARFPQLLDCVHFDCGLWEYRIGDKEFGPFSNKQMKSWFDLGKLPNNLPVRRKLHEKILRTVPRHERQGAEQYVLVGQCGGFKRLIPYDDPFLCSVSEDDSKQFEGVGFNLGAAYKQRQLRDKSLQEQEDEGRGEDGRGRRNRDEGYYYQEYDEGYDRSHRRERRGGDRERRREQRGYEDYYVGDYYYEEGGQGDYVEYEGRRNRDRHQNGGESRTRRRDGTNINTPRVDDDHYEQEYSGRHGYHDRQYSREHTRLDREQQYDRDGYAIYDDAYYTERQHTREGRDEQFYDNGRGGRAQRDRGQRVRDRGQRAGGRDDYNYDHLQDGGGNGRSGVRSSPRENETRTRTRQRAAANDRYYADYEGGQYYEEEYHADRRGVGNDLEERVQNNREEQNRGAHQKEHHNAKGIKKGNQNQAPPPYHHDKQRSINNHRAHHHQGTGNKQQGKRSS